MTEQAVATRTVEVTVVYCDGTDEVAEWDNDYKEQAFNTYVSSLRKAVMGEVDPHGKHVRSVSMAWYNKDANRVYRRIKSGTIGCEHRPGDDRR